jgi:hypothetical protein
MNLKNFLKINPKNLLQQRTTMLTKEQELVVYSSGNIKVNAFAGTGKTTTIIEYVKARPTNTKILYLVFNKSVKNEAVEKFKAHGINNVVVETAHSLAFREIVKGTTYKVKLSSYKTQELVGMLQLKVNGQRHIEYVLANHVLKYVAMFCNSEKKTVLEIDYLSSFTDDKKRIFVAQHLPVIEKQTREFLKKMNSCKIECSHDFYLKKYQLSNPKLDYDYILFDEGQDASSCILDIFMKQTACKVIVGDTHQQIYSWRYAINSLEKANFNSFSLSTSFRFHQDIADLANTILGYKMKLKIIPPETKIEIQGKGNSTQQRSYAIIGRTNIGLLYKAIAFIKREPNKTIYFEGNINSYTYAEDGASLYDIYYLSVGKPHKIKDPVIKKMFGMDELDEYIKATDDIQLSMMRDIVNDYGNDIFSIMSDLKSMHLTDADRKNADVVFSTVHKAKGQEYDTVELIQDFVTEEKINGYKDSLEGKVKDEDEKKRPVDITKINEEINLLYVAVTRAKHKLLIPETLVPAVFAPKTSFIEILKIPKTPDVSGKLLKSPEELNQTIKQLKLI